MIRIGQLEPYREPRMWQEPNAIPKPPEPELIPRNGVKKNGLGWLGFGILIGLFMLVSEPPRRKRKKRVASKLSGTLYALWRPESSDRFQRIPMERWPDYTLRQEAGKGKLRFVEAESLREAQSLALEGATANCGWWEQRLSDKTGKWVWKCAKYAPVCDPPRCEVGIVGRIRKCIQMQNVPSITTAKGFVRRCKKYVPICTTGVCLPEPMPKPEVEEEPEISEKEVRSIATGLARHYNEMQEEAGPALAREILDRGGIRKYRGVHEEYANIPLHLKRRRGLPLDEMASEMLMEEKELVAAIEKAYPRGRKVVRRKTWEDFQDQARQIIFQEHRERLTGLGAVKGKRKRFSRASIDEAVDAALALKADVPMYVFATYYGYKVEPQGPPGLQPHLLVFPSGKIEEHTSQYGEEIIRVVREADIPDPEQLPLFGQEQRELWKLKRELVLKTQDPATSDDPLEICLQRIGWDIPRVRELQVSISEKLTPDLFTQKTTPLSPGEKQVQRDIQSCLDALRAGRTSAKPAELKLFGEAQAELFLRTRTMTQEDPIPVELEMLAVHARQFDPKLWLPEYAEAAIAEKYRKIHRTIALPASVKGKYPKPLENILAYHYGYASGDPERSIQAFWYHAHGYAPDHGTLPEFLKYPTFGDFGQEQIPLFPQIFREQLPLFPSKKPERETKDPEPLDHWMKSAPFTVPEMRQYNAYTFYEQDFNKEYGQTVKAVEQDVRNRIAAYGLAEVPPDVQKAINYYRKRLYFYYRTKFRSRSYAPPPMVVGPAKYPTHRLEKAEKWERDSWDLVEKSKRKLETAVNRQIKGKTAIADVSEWEQAALSMRRTAFGQYYHKMELRRHENIKTGYADDLRRGLFADTIRKQGRELHEKLLKNAIKQGKAIPENIVQDYKILREIAHTAPAIEKPKEQLEIEKERRAAVKREKRDISSAELTKDERAVIEVLSKKMMAPGDVSGALLWFIGKTHNVLSEMVNAGLIYKRPAGTYAPLVKIVETKKAKSEAQKKWEKAKRAAYKVTKRWIPELALTPAQELAIDYLNKRNMTTDELAQALEMKSFEAKTLVRTLEHNDFILARQSGKYAAKVRIAHTDAEIEQMKAQQAKPSKPEVMVLEVLQAAKAPVHMDRISEVTGLPMYELSAALVQLELKGKVHQQAGKLFSLKGPELGSFYGAPAYVWKSTLREFTERQRTKDDPALPQQLNWILKRTKTNPEGNLRVFRGRLPGHMQRKLREWLWLRYHEPEKWLEDKRLKINYREYRGTGTYNVYHPFYALAVTFYPAGNMILTENRGNYHIDALREAIAEKKPVPKKVLREYAPYLKEAAALL